jgi:hypothetical protein
MKTTKTKGMLDTIAAIKSMLHPSLFLKERMTNATPNTKVIKLNQIVSGRRVSVA